MITDREILFPNVFVDRISVIKLSGKEYTLWQSTNNNPDAYSFFEEIVIEEDMFAGAITGYISIKDSSYITEQLNLSTFDSILFTIDGKKCGFRVMNIETPTDFASKQIHGPAGIASIITIRFTSDEFLYRNFDIQPLANFIGKISKVSNSSVGNQETSTATEGGGGGGGSTQVSLVEGVPSDLVEAQDEAAMKGFVSTLVQSMSGNGQRYVRGEPFVQLGGWSGKNCIADDTFNDIWLKPNPAFYPFSKLSNNSRMHQLMNYVCEYACLKQKPDRVDFFFWEDLDNWNFKSIFSLATENENFKGTYYPGENTLLENSIVSMEIINELNIPQLFDTGCLFSEYIRIVPNWGDVYRSNLDSGASLIKRQISYVYDTNIIRPIIARFPPANKITLDALKSKRNPPIPFNTNRLVDNNYGYYSSPYNTKNSPWWNFYNHMSDGYTGDRMKELELIQTEEDLLDTNKRFDFGEMSRLETEYWQSQFDFCELPGAVLRKIYKEIKWPLAQARRHYAKLKQAKNKWSTYKKNICCEREVPLNFFAILTNADKIHGATFSSSFARDSGGIYGYSWAEVEIWPKSYLNSTDIWHKAKKIIEFEDQNFPFVFVMPSGGLLGGATKEYELKSTDPLVRGIGADGRGITEIKAGKYFTPDTRAFNINELLNSVAPIAFEDGTAYKTLLMSPGITDVLGTLTTNRNNYTNYPTETVMMPVGKFRIISSTCPDFSKSGTELPVTSLGQNSGGFYYGGRIVQMHAIPKNILQSFYETSPFGATAEEIYKKPDLGITGLPYTFLFDVENAHDGLCNSDNCQ